MARTDCNHDAATRTIAAFASLVGRVYPSSWSRHGTITLGGFCRHCGRAIEATFDVEGRPA